ncbi:cellulose binding domain-containing protein [Streptomyces sp. bgisy032]|uniref:cellulose binding domain-containing protein n=1 Tax=Streptomyces sp. bgisy032 TaxID=3413773 RepID=UPI003D71B8C9
MRAPRSGSPSSAPTGALGARTNRPGLPATWEFGAGRRIRQTRSAGRTPSGTAVSWADASCNGSAPDGGSVPPGCNPSWSGSSPVPVVALWWP